MKKIALTLGVFVFAVFTAFAQQPAAPATQVDNPNAPEIKFSKLVHDYGNVNKDGDGNCEFEFQNVGKEPLVLSDCRSSCGCTVPSWTREPILPGKKGSIKVKYDTKRVGPINKTVTVMSNAKTASVVLRIQGNVINTDTPAAPVKPASPTTPTTK
ncbi:MAG: DUF1573 domain-containing protein [Bacteroidales bacterium]